MNNADRAGHLAGKKPGAVGDNAPAVRTVDITKSFGSGNVLGGISLDIARGEQLAIMGPSGSGKSTLLYCMSGVLLPTSGEVYVGAANTIYNITDASDKERSKLRLGNFGFVFQDSQLLPELSAAENVALPLRLAGVARGKALTDARKLLDQVGLGELGERHPGELSGGQAQRVAIARALVGSPQVIFADEPTGALDQATGHETVQLLTTVASGLGASLIMVTHDAAVASWCQRIVEIRDGIVHSDREVRS